jgi:signal transduction histidine kinase
VEGADLERERRWVEWLLRRNQRGMRSVLWIVASLYPLFGVLDYLVAPPAALRLLYATRAVVTVITLLLFREVKRDWFRRHPNLISSSYMILISAGISLMTVFMGGLASPYYAGLSLVIVASGLLFVWPPPVVIITYAAIVALFLLPSLIINDVGNVLTAISNQFFLISTAIIAGAGQTLGYRSQREQVENQIALEKTSEDLALAHEQLKRLDRFKSEFFANITHELKTPLTLILAPLALLIEGKLGSVSDAQRSTFQSMQRSGVKLSRLIGDLLDLSKLEESRLRLRVEQHELVAYLRTLIAQIEPLAQRKNISLSLHAEASSADVWCDIDRIERVFVNLLSNATKFTEAGGSVRVRVRDEAQAVLVEVADTGLGFPSHLAKDVFRRFFQVDMAGTRRHGGVGLGLALARELVALHDGEIWAESEPGKGARFFVRLRKDRDHFSPEILDRRGPAVDRVGGQRETDVSLAEWQLDTPKHFRLMEIDEATEQRLVDRDEDEDERQHTVLVVEDTPDITRMIRLALHHDFRFLAAGDGEQGLELARRYRPTVIVTDWMMPKMDGLELTRRLRADPQTKHIPIVMLTARGDVEDKVSGLESGVNAYLSKPFASSELVSTVRSLVRDREATADALLSEKMDSLETIAGGLAHEIRNPLNYLKNAVAIVERDCRTLLETLRVFALEPPHSGTVEKLDARLQKMFDVSDAGIKRIANTVDLMVRYSREGYSRSPSPYDAYAAARDVVAVVVSTVSYPVQVELDLDGNGVVSGVHEEFNQLLTNLIQNALEAVATDGTGSVLVKGRNEGVDLVLSVKDNGAGIPEAERARIFDAFYTTKSSLVRGQPSARADLPGRSPAQVGRGMGLGLTISRRVVVAMGGSLTVRSQVGHGSEFVVRVPSCAASSESTEAAG